MIGLLIDPRGLAPAPAFISGNILFDAPERYHSPRTLLNETMAVDPVLQRFDELIQRLDRIETTLDSLVSQRAVKEWYSTGEIAEILGKAHWTVREWARTDRIHAEKRSYGRGNSLEWMVSHEELQRIQNEGLLLVDRYRHVK